MKFTISTFLALSAFLIAACSSSKPATTTVAAASPGSGVSSLTSVPVLTRASNGVFTPGDEQLAAIRARYKDVTIQTLTTGHSLYTGVCTNCHGTKNIYNYSDEAWRDIIDDMGTKARISGIEKDAVYKYVLSIKATQPK